MITRALTGPALQDALHDVARLRIEVFRAWPYLYDGDLEYEARYLASFAASPQAIVVGAFDGDNLVGASTAAPLSDHADDFASAFDATDFDLNTVFYCAESVLLPKYRGQGLGHAFFDVREAHAKSCGFDHSVFCSVLRPSDHPARPGDYRPLDAFWTSRGYQPLDGVIAHFRWKDLGQTEETSKPLQFWHRAL